MSDYLWECLLKPADQIESMAELRVAIDALDRDLVALLARRVTLIDRAIALKPVENMPARIEARVEDVVAKVRAEAERIGYDAGFAEQLWRQIIDWSIAREERVLGTGDDA